MLFSLLIQTYFIAYNTQKDWPQVTHGFVVLVVETSEKMLY